MVYLKFMVALGLIVVVWLSTIFALFHYYGIGAVGLAFFLTFLTHVAKEIKIAD